ncbi:DUF3426 domain-containing protein [Uliginosibacterium gangwonense]|uniref:DUF3426 domain-containing protein n=1 Tax=Uliginosibacterium gangwonense TaxID=392736 RepID=UPI00037DFCA6|nr:DUF3426 domain-containing protein [Uliginosibacterium gangwonense]
MLTTRCPNCGRVFRIRPEQLGVRGGRVRCGTCQTAFSALQTLEEIPDDVPLSSMQPQAGADTNTPRPTAAPVPAPTSAAPVPTGAASSARVAPPASAAASRPVTPPVQAPVAATRPTAPITPSPATQAPATAKPVTAAPAQPNVAKPVVPPTRPAPEAVPAAPTRPQAAAPVAPPQAAQTPSSPAPINPAVPKVESAPVADPTPTEPPIEPDGRKEPSLDATWWEIDPNLPLGGFQEVAETSQLRSHPLSEELDLPAIHDAPPLIDPAKLNSPTSASKEAESFRMEFDLSGVEGAAAAAPATPVEPAEPAHAVKTEPYKSKIAAELGVAPFDPSQDDHGGMTYMLDDSLVEPPRPAAKTTHPVVDETSLLYLHEQQQKSKKRRPVEDRRRTKRAWPWVLGIGLFILLATVQLVYLFRVEIARAMPETRTYLEQACREVGCTVPYPRDSAQIIIDGSNLVADQTPEGRSRLIVTIRNKANYSVAWPDLELTLTDKFDIAISRRVLKPKEWLPENYAQMPAFDGHSEVTTNVLLETGKQEPAGYRIYSFYP